MSQAIALKVATGDRVGQGGIMSEISLKFRDAEASFVH